jgi:hypothetical protein
VSDTQRLKNLVFGVKYSSWKIQNSRIFVRCLR